MNRSFANAGITAPCPRCMVPAGTRCRSNSGRTLLVTHESRAQAAGNADTMRAWVAERLAVWTA